MRMKGIRMTENEAKKAPATPGDGGHVVEGAIGNGQLLPVGLVAIAFVEDDFAFMEYYHLATGEHFGTNAPINQ